MTEPAVEILASVIAEHGTGNRRDVVIVVRAAREQLVEPGLPDDEEPTTRATDAKGR